MRQIDADVVVIGGGGSGLAAACAAREEGVHVVLLEKTATLGGTTSLSVGSITAAATSWQRKKGIVDTPDEHFEDMSLFLGKLAHRDNMELRRVLVDNVTETLEWLKSIGLTFYGPMPEPPHKKPRMHTVLPNSRAYPYYLGREARRLGVEIHCNAKIVGLIKENDRVTGADTTIDGQNVRVTAKRAVILATGDISAAVDIKSDLRRDVADVDAINVHSTGDGQRIGVALGGALVNGDLMRAPALRFKAPAADNFLRRLPPSRLLTKCMTLAMDVLPMAVLRPFMMSFMTSSMSPEATLFKSGALLINKNGERFTDEVGQPALDIATQPGKNAWIMFDDSVAKKFAAWPNFISTAPGLAYAYLDDYRRTRKDLYLTADSVLGLATKMGVPADRLESTIKHYNNDAACKEEGRGTFTKSPFHVLGPIQAWIILADVGLTVDTQHRVLNTSGKVFPGLYAVGSAGQGGVMLAGHGHHIGWAITSGRRAGRLAARETVQAKVAQHEAA